MAGTRTAGSRPFGWNVRRTEHVEDEAAVIRELADRLIKGESLTSVVRDLNEREVPTAGYADRLAKAKKEPGFDPGRPIRWDIRKVRQVLSNQRHAGRVEHRGKVVTNDQGAPVKAQWEPILDPDTFDRLQAALENRRHVSGVWTGGRRHLLSGTLLRCAVCGQKVRPFQQTSGKHAYRCLRHLTRDRDLLDEYVLAQVRQRITDHPVSLDSLKIETARASVLSDEIDALVTRAAAVDAKLCDPDGGDFDWLVGIRETIGAELETKRADRIEILNEETGWEWVPLIPSRLETSGSLLPNDDPSKADVIAKQRFAIALYVRQIQVFPTKVRGRFFDTDAIKIHWRDPSKISARGRLNKDTGEMMDVHAGPDKAPAP